MCDQTVPPIFCFARSEWGHARAVSYEGLHARVDGWIFSHTGEDQIDIEDNVWGWVVTMIYDHDPWWWWGHWVWHWPSATTAMIASEIQTSFNLQVCSFKPTRFLAIWFVNICDGSWIIKLNRLGWEIDHISMKWLLQGASSLRQSPWCEDTVPVGATKRRKCWRNYTRLPTRDLTPKKLYISHLRKRKIIFKSALGYASSQDGMLWVVPPSRMLKVKGDNCDHVASVAGREDSPNCFILY